jgi:hypothetical protein
VNDTESMVSLQIQKKALFVLSKGILLGPFISKDGISVDP